LAGAVTYIGGLGVWTLNVSTGVSKPVIGSAENPSMDLNSVDYSSSAGILTITWFDNGYTGLGGANMEIGGTTAGTIAYGAYQNNALIGTTGSLGGTFAMTTGGSLPYDSTPYSLSEAITIVHSGAGISSFDAALSVPEPGTLLFLGAGLITLFGIRRRRI
jgi:hypothetical protein